MNPQDHVNENSGAPLYESRPSYRQNACPCQPTPFWQVMLKDLLLTVVGIGLLGGMILFLPVALIIALACGLSGFDQIETGSTSGTLNADIAATVIDGNENAEAKVAVIPFEGLVESDAADASAFWTVALKEAEEDESVKAIVLRVNSPGGTVAGSAYYHRMIRQLKEKRDIPIVVSMGDLAASGGYYISAASDEIFAEPATWTGSIGVICPLVNAAELCQKLGVRSNAVTSGAMKGMGSAMKEPTEEEMQTWQALVDESYEGFLDVVVEGRPWYRADDVEDQAQKERTLAERREELRIVADGRIYTAQQALDAKLVDKIGYLDEAIDSALEKAGLDKENAQIVLYGEKETFLQALGLGVSAQEKPLEKAAKAAAQLAAPKAFYICPNALPM